MKKLRFTGMPLLPLTGMILPLMMLILPLFSLAQQAGEPGFVITGDVKGVMDGSAVYLTDANNPTDTLTKSIAKDGHFVLTGHIPEPNLYDINFGSAQKKTVLFLGNDKIGIGGEVADLRTISVTGSPSNDDFMSFQKVFNPYFAHLNEVGKLSNSPEGAGKMDSLSRVYKKLVDTVEMNIDRFIGAHRSSYVSPFVLAVLLQLSEDIMREEKRLNSLAPEVQGSYYGKMMQTQIAAAKIGAVGTPALDFTETDTAGRPVSLSSFKGKYVLVDFWASWCGPCRMENPNVVSTFSKFRNKNFTVLGVSLDKAKDPWIKAIKDDHLTWTQVSDLQFWNNAVAVKYHVTQIPTNLLIDPSGKIVGKNLRGQDLTNKLCELLGCD